MHTFVCVCVLCAFLVFRRYSLVLHVILAPTNIGNLTYYVPVMNAGDELAA